MLNRTLRRNGGVIRSSSDFYHHFAETSLMHNPDNIVKIDTDARPVRECTCYSFNKLMHQSFFVARL